MIHVREELSLDRPSRILDEADSAYRIKYLPQYFVGDFHKLYGIKLRTVNHRFAFKKDIGMQNRYLPQLRNRVDCPRTHMLDIVRYDQILYLLIEAVNQIVFMIENAIDVLIFIILDLKFFDA